jgi:hypothetical protein
MIRMHEELLAALKPSEMDIKLKQHKLDSSLAEEKRKQEHEMKMKFKKNFLKNKS